MKVLSSFRRAALAACVLAATVTGPAVDPDHPGPVAGFRVQGWVEPPPRDPLASNQWALTRLAAVDARARAGTAPVTVAVVDSGVDLSHPEFAGRGRAGADFIAGGAGGHDPNGHGTHVAGIIAAAVDGALVEGLAPHVDVVAVRVLDETGYGDDALVAAGIDWATDAGVDIINLSLGSPDDHPGVRAAVERAVRAGIVVVAAAGNDGPGSAPMYPAALPGVITVAATTAVDSPALFSATGAHVDIAAPGFGILSTTPGADTGWMSGTSQAAPYVSAAAALLLATEPDLAPAQVADRLVATAYPLDVSGYGAGVVDVVAALGGPATAPGPARPELVPPTSPGCCTLPDIGRSPGTPRLPDVPDPHAPAPFPTPTPGTVDPPPDPTVGGHDGPVGERARLRPVHAEVAAAPAVGAVRLRVRVPATTAPGAFRVELRDTAGTVVADRPVGPRATFTWVLDADVGDGPYRVVLTTPAGDLSSVEVVVDRAGFVDVHARDRVLWVVAWDATGGTVHVDRLDGGHWVPARPVPSPGPGPWPVPVDDAGVYRVRYGSVTSQTVRVP